RYGCLDIAVPRNHDNRHFRVLLLEAVEELQAIQAATLKPDIKKNEIGPTRHDGRQRVIAGARSARAGTLILQDARDELADIGFIVDDQDIGCHGCRPYPENYSAAVRVSSAP